MRTLLTVLFLVLTSAFSGYVLAEEDDGRSYGEIAKWIGPGNGSAPVHHAMNYDYWSVIEINKYLNAVEEKSAAGAERTFDPDARCSTYHENYTRDGVIDIRYALGYFDDSLGHNIIYSNQDWGSSPSYDEGVAVGIRKVLTDACPNSSRRVCGFTELSSASERLRDGTTVLTRQMDLHGRSVEVRMTLTYASASPFYERNRTVLREKQERYTRASEENFFGGLRKADFVIYQGHSRVGGGPDFSPPRLTKAGKPDYAGYYHKRYPGRTRMIEEMRNGGNKDMTLGLFSCDSNLHFISKVKGANKNQRMILTLGGEGFVTYPEAVNVSMAYLEGLLRGSCGTQLDGFARLGAREFRAYKQFGLN